MIPIAKPLIGPEEQAAVLRPLASGWLTQGPEVAAFEREFATAVGAAHACAVSNCTTALHLALRAVGVGPGDEVVTVSHSFIATANAVRYCGAVPVFVDIEPATFNIDPRRLEAALTARTRAILCVHQMGMPCDLQAIVAFAQVRGLRVIEDAACAAGSEIAWRGAWQRIGRPHGDIACFSFHPRKVLTTGDGGMLTTANADYDAQFRLWRQHGMSVADTTRHGSAQVILESYSTLGFNYRMTDVQAAIGREQLKRLARLVSRRRLLADRYRRLLAAVDGVTLPAEPAWARSNWQSYCVRLADRLDQRRVMQAMLDDGVSTRRGIMCAHREPAYGAAGQPYVAAGSLRESERAQDHGILLPLFDDLSETEQEAVVGALVRACHAQRHVPVET